MKPSSSSSSSFVFSQIIREVMLMPTKSFDDTSVSYIPINRENQEIKCWMEHDTYKFGDWCCSARMMFTEFKCYRPTRLSQTAGDDEEEKKNTRFLPLYQDFVVKLLMKGLTFNILSFNSPQQRLLCLFY